MRGLPTARRFALPFCLVLSACSVGAAVDAGNPIDGSTADAPGDDATTDAGPPDAGPPDLGVADAGSSDLGAFDARVSDLATVDGPSIDTGIADAACVGSSFAVGCPTGQRDCTNGIVSICYPTASCDSCCDAFTGGSGMCVSTTVVDAGPPGTCPAFERRCGGVCVSSYDALNCGACGRTCPMFATCMPPGICECMPGMLFCPPGSGSTCTPAMPNDAGVWVCP